MSRFSKALSDKRKGKKADKLFSSLCDPCTTNRKFDVLFYVMIFHEIKIQYNYKIIISLKRTTEMVFSSNKLRHRALEGNWCKKDGGSLHRNCRTCSRWRGRSKRYFYCEGLLSPTPCNLDTCSPTW